MNQREPLNRKTLSRSILFVLTALLSIYYTGSFWLDTGGKLFILLVLIAVWELGKIVYAEDLVEILTFSNLVGRTIRIALVLVLSFVFISGSLAYTVGGVLVEGQRENRALIASSAAASAEIPALQFESVELSEKIERLKGTIADYKARKWPDNQRKTELQLDRALERKKEIAARLDALNGVAGDRALVADGASPRFSALASAWLAWGLPSLEMDAMTHAQVMERGWSLMIGLLIELLNISLLLDLKIRSLTGWSPKDKGRSPKATEQRPESGTNAPNTGTNTPDDKTIWNRPIWWNEEFESKFQRVKAAVISKEIRPSMNKIREFAPCNADTSEIFRQRLIWEGICRREAGERVVLAEPETALMPVTTPEAA